MDIGQKDRAYWLATMSRIAEPVLTASASRQLKATMPVESNGTDRAAFTHLEALARLLTGIAPWLETPQQIPLRVPQEEELRQRYASLARLALDAATDPASPDYCNFSFSSQPIVDTAFLAHALLRAPTELWEKLDARVRQQLIEALKLTRTRKPPASNWLLFSAIIETALYRFGEPLWDPMRIDYALKQHEQWYLGDGFYGDGPELHVDYYNSFVIQPMLIDIIETMGTHYPDWEELKERILLRARRYAAVLERLISPEGTFPVVGRSIAYRFGAFHLLAQMALRQDLPAAIVPAQVRCALTAVIKRMIEMPGTFDEQGWLTIGFCGHQPELGETYISTGSLYLCATAFLPLGLTAEQPFWQGEADWTARKAWGGQFTVIDKAQKESLPTPGVEQQKPLKKTSTKKRATSDRDDRRSLQRVIKPWRSANRWFDQEDFDDTPLVQDTHLFINGFLVHAGQIVDGIQVLYGEKSAGPLTPPHGNLGDDYTKIELEPGDRWSEISGFSGRWFGGDYVLQLTFSTHQGKVYGPFGDMMYAQNRQPFRLPIQSDEKILALSGVVSTGDNGKNLHLGALGLILYKDEL